MKQELERGGKEGGESSRRKKRRGGQKAMKMTLQEKKQMSLWAKKGAKGNEGKRVGQKDWTEKTSATCQAEMDSRYWGRVIGT